MTASDVGATPPGLRERKKQRTRDTLARVALELFDERGYDETTLDDIAEAADVSKRTIFSYYQSKEDILFHDEPRILQEMEHRLQNRPPGTTTVDALGDLLVTFVPGEGAALRKRVIGSNDVLRRSERARFGRMEELLAASIGQDLQAGPGDLRPLLLAASMTAAFTVALDSILTHATHTDGCHDQAATTFGQLLGLLRSGVEELQRES